jgi:ribose transport system substrate-binding protein
MIKNRFFSLIGGLVILSFIFMGCTGGNDTESATDTVTEEDAPIVIGLSLSTLDNPFFQSVKAGAEDSAGRLGVELVVEGADDDAAMQETQILAMIEQGVSALLINPVDGDAIVPAIEAANAAGILVLTVDRSAASGDILAHIASDNAAGGLMAGRFLVETIKESGTVVELEGIPGTSAAQDRGAGFNEALVGYDDITILAQVVANFSRAEGKDVFAELLAEHETITAVFAHNDEMILGAIEAANEAGRTEDIVFVGFDAVDEAISALEDGDLAATVAQQPVEMGRLSVETAVAALNGEQTNAFIPVELALITR